MFKLEKILGASDSVPEIISVTAPYGMAINAGYIYFIAQNSLSYERPSDPVRFCALETLKDGHEAKRVKGFVVTHDMIFEADVNGNFNESNLGDPFSFSRDNSGNMASICRPEEGDGSIEGIIWSKEGFGKARKLHVLFN